MRLGCRVEYLFRPDVAQNGAEAAAGQDERLDPYIHLYLLNRGILMTPFHNMALMSPATTARRRRPAHASMPRWLTSWADSGESLASHRL